jgi:flagellar basal-body rod modification protein FlgD
MTAIDPVGAGQPAQTSTPTTGVNSLNSPDTFLKLLVAELKYQNPMNPTDPNQYLAQTAQFSMVQQLDTLASSEKSLLAATQQAAASALIDRKVTGTTATGSPVSGTVTGVSLVGGEPELQIGNTTVPLGNVTAVGSATATTTTTTKA